MKLVVLTEDNQTRNKVYVNFDNVTYVTVAYNKSTVSRIFFNMSLDGDYCCLDVEESLMEINSLLV